MAELVSAYTDEASNTVVTISKALAESSGVTVLKSDPPLDRNGRPRGPREGKREATAKKAAETTTSGTAASKESKS